MSAAQIMKAVGYSESLPISDKNSLVDIELPCPTATGRDLLVKINAIAVNPVDYKIRRRVSPESGNYKVLGWDAVGEVIAVGSEVEFFKPGDQVFYAGDLNRQGCNGEYQLVDERIVGLKPQHLSDAEAAALPLTSLTAWEMLFDHLAFQPQDTSSQRRSEQVVLIVGAAGGVGSIFLQLAKALTQATLIATASRENSIAWVKELGAHYVVDHSKPLVSQLEALGIGPVTHVASLNDTARYFESYVEMLVPFGKIAMIDDPDSLNIMKLKPKSLSLHLEFMFARSMFDAADIVVQSQILNKVSELVDSGVIKTTLGKNLGTINASNLKRAHKELESGTAIGKIVLEGFN